MVQFKRAPRWARPVDFDSRGTMALSEFAIETLRHIIRASGQRCTDSRVSDRVSWRKKSHDRHWNPHSERSSTQTRRRTSGRIQASGWTNNPSAFLTRVICRKPFSPLDVMHNRFIGVTLALTLAHCFFQTTSDPAA